VGHRGFGQALSSTNGGMLSMVFIRYLTGNQEEFDLHVLSGLMYAEE
jgi:hypothetical protein